MTEPVFDSANDPRFNKVAWARLSEQFLPYDIDSLDNRDEDFIREVSRRHHRHGANTSNLLPLALIAFPKVPASRPITMVVADARYPPVFIADHQRQKRGRCTSTRWPTRRSCRCRVSSTFLKSVACVRVTKNAESLCCR